MPGYHNGGDIFCIERLVVGIDAQALEHTDQALLGENVARKRIAASVQADNQTITDQYIIADTFNFNDILDPRLCDCAVRPGNAGRKYG